MNEQTRLYDEPVRPEDKRLRELAETLIPEGPRTMPRSMLGELYGGGETGDRRGRKAIEDMRQAGAVIINQQDGRGYYRPSDDDVDAVLHQLRSTHSRAMALLKQEKAQREWLRERGIEA